MSNPREEVLLTDLAIIGCGLISVSLLEKDDDEDFLLKLSELDLKILVVDLAGWVKLKRILTEKKLDLIVVFLDPIPNDDQDIFVVAGIRVVDFQSLLLYEPCYLFQEPDPGAWCVFSYTNGTTGRASLVKLTHQDLMAALTPIIFQSFDIKSEDVYVMYTNLALFGERIMLYTLGVYGVSIGFSQNLQQDLPILQPTMMIAVPRILDFLCSRIKKKVALKSKLSEKIFNKCLKNTMEHVSATGKPSKNLIQKMVFSEIRRSFGGRLRIILTGASPVLDETLHFFQACLGVEVFEGFGLVETGYSNFYGQGLLRPLNGTQVKLKYLPSINVEGLDKNFYGELLVKLDYFKAVVQGNENNLNFAQPGQWINTGDLFLVDRKNFGFKFLERVRFCMTGSAGFTVFPQRLEMIYRKSKFVAQILVYTDFRIDGIVAVVVVDEGFLRDRWGNSFLINDLTDNRLLIKEILMDFQKIAKDFNLKIYERVVDVIVECEPWTSGLYVTGSLKLKRKVLLQKYFDRIESSIRSLDRKQD
jgi:long-chain acyl-CoA synthetase